VTAQMASDFFSPKAFVSVSGMARMVGLSRGHFWELCKQGVFPRPAYSISNNRPFYDVEAQEACLRVRATNVGHNGEPVIFYANRNGEEPAQVKGPRTDPRYASLSRILKQKLGLDVTPQQVEAAAKTLFPEGLPAENMLALIRAVTTFTLGRCVARIR